MLEIVGMKPNHLTSEKLKVSKIATMNNDPCCAQVLYLIVYYQILFIGVITDKANDFCSIPQI